MPEFFYSTRGTAGTVSVPSYGRLKTVEVEAPSGFSLTLNIGSGPDILVPAGRLFKQVVVGDAVGESVDISGADPAKCFIGWEVYYQSN